MLQVVQAYDRSPIAQVATDDADALQAKLNLAARTFRDRDHWLLPFERLEILSRLASAMDAERDRLSHSRSTVSQKLRGLNFGIVTWQAPKAGAANMNGKSAM